MMSAREIKAWLDSLHPDAAVGISEGGLSLIEVDGDAYLEVGGLPEGDDR
jgi:hypothetical protein